MHGEGVLARAAAATLFAPMPGLMRLLTAACFRHFDVVGAGRVPRGPVLFVANHPATWTDVVVLDVAVGRRLHFLAHETLFRPWFRRAVLRLYGTLPVWYRGDDDATPDRNRRTFERCHALLARGDAIAIFPEGVSDTDRTLRPLKTGAARLWLEQAGAGGTVPALVPVAIRYEDRVAFRTDVTVVFGTPLEGHPGRAPADTVENADAHALTREIAVAIEAALAEAADVATREAGVRPQRPAPSARRRMRAALVPFAVAGRVLHTPALDLIEHAVHALAPLPQQIAFGRMGAAIVVLPVWYLILGVALGTWAGWRWSPLVFAVPALGWIACLDYDVRRARDRARTPEPGGPAR